MDKNGAGSDATGGDETRRVDRIPTRSARGEIVAGIPLRGRILLVQ